MLVDLVLVHLGAKECLVNLGRKDYLVFLGKMVLLENQVRLDSQEKEDKKGNLDFLD